MSLLNKDGKTGHRPRARDQAARSVPVSARGHGHSLSIEWPVLLPCPERCGRGGTNESFVPGASFVTWVYDEPMGSNRLGNQKQLNASLEWNFPIAGGVAGRAPLPGQQRHQRAGDHRQASAPWRRYGRARDGSTRNFQRPLTQTVFVSISLLI